MASSSTLTEPVSEVRREIEALFCWNPHRLHPGPLSPGKKATTSTRPPAFYDKHFDNRLVLRHVKRLPSLVQDLATNVDQALLAASETLPPAFNAMTAEQREWDMRNMPRIVRDEKGVANFYDKTTARYCTPVASTLALHPKASMSEWRSLLLWTQSVSSSRYAIMDGELQIMEVVDEDDARLEAIMDTMDGETRRIFEEMRESRSSSGTWEIKSIATGSDDIMRAVRNLGKFSWTHCPDVLCSTTAKHQEQMDLATHTAVGPDAQNPPWNLNSDTIDAASLRPLTNASVQPPPRRSVRFISQPAPHASTSSMPPPPPPKKVSAHTSPVQGKGKRKASPVGHKEERASTQSGGKRKAGKRKLDGEDDDADDDDDDNDEAYKNSHDLTAQSLVQQAWAQAVKVDGTVIVLHSGNYELVCLRHRGTNTLYVSDLIEPPTCKDPGYGKLHVGIYIAGIQDAIDRRKQQQHHTSPSGSPDDGDDDSAGFDNSKDDQNSDPGGHSKGSRGGRRGNSRGGRGRGKRSGFQSKAGKKDAYVDESVAVKVAENRDVLLLYLRYGVYDSPIPATFLRSAPAITEDKKNPALLSPRAISSYRTEDCLTIILTSEIGQGATGVVHRGTLGAESSGGSIPLDVVVKLAFDSEQRDALKREYEMYYLLRSKGVVKGITTVLGSFDDFEGGPSALVMLYAGVSLVMKPERVLSASERDVALTTLKSIHCIGILHGDIRPENILVSSSGITIIDFGHSRRCNNQVAKNKEYQQLRSLLVMACECDREGSSSHNE